MKNKLDTQQIGDNYKNLYDFFFSFFNSETNLCIIYTRETLHEAS